MWQARGERARAVIASIAVGIATIFATSVSAKTVAKRTVIAVHLIAKESEAVAAQRAALRWFAKEARETSGVTLLASPWPVKRGREPEAALAACGPKLDCIAKVGRSLAASEVFFGRIVVREGGGLVLQGMVIGCRVAAIARTVSFEIPELSQLPYVLARNLPAIVGSSGDGRLVVPGYDGKVDVDGALIGNGAGPFTLAAGYHRVVLDGGAADEVLILPATTRSLAAPVAIMASEPPIAAAAREPAVAPVPKPVVLVTPPEPYPVAPVAPSTPSAEKVVPEPALVLPGPQLPPAHQRAAALRAVGWAAAGVGVAAIAAGTLFGLRASRADADLESAKRGGDGMTQLAAIARHDDASTAAARANVAFAAGGVALAVGVGCLVWNLIAPAASGATPSATGAGAQAQWAW
jgi:hypothetical protein